MEIINKKYNLIDVIKISFSCSPQASILIMMQKVLSGIIPSLQILATARFIDTAVLVVRDGLEIKTIFPSLSYVVILIAFQWLTGDLTKLAFTRLRLAIKVKFRTAITDKRSRLEYRHIENHETWDLISRVAKEPEKLLMRAFLEILDGLSLAIRVTGVVLILVTQVWWAALIIVGVSIPLMFVAVKSGKATYEANRKASRSKREYEYLEKVLLDREAVNERTLFGFSKNLNKVWLTHHDRARKIEVHTRLKWFIRMKSSSLITATISIMVIFVLLNPVIAGVITIGMFIALVNAVFSMVQMMSWQFTHIVDQMAHHREFMKDITDFAALSECENMNALPDIETPVFESLEFIDVKFSYPGTEAVILDGVSFKITPETHYAFVGINGAGKTTITKLMTGLYDNYEGSILLNGKEIRDYSKARLKSFYSIVYQDFVRYYISLKENIAIGDINNRDNNQDEKVKNAIQSIELEGVIDNFKDGIDTNLGKIRTGGMDVSGGEWQRIAMARAIMNPAPFRILDEPTAALDPISESRLYEKFEDISIDKTTLFISHRLGSTKLADIIFVLGEGKVLSSGTHIELMENCLEYSQMYESQRGWYQ